MAKHAKIDMSECRLLEENNRAHFMTRRFDRIEGQKLHMQSLCGIAHFDFNEAGIYSYEQAFSIMRKLRLSKKEAIQQYRRMVFNVVATNHDDHTKNIAFLMDRDGIWSLSPAYDVTFARDPQNQWLRQHQMTINGKQKDFTREDLIAVAGSISLPRPDKIIDEVVAAVADWSTFANDAGVSKSASKDRAQYHRLRMQ
jgi:serine/threonine-protein kinase HipA